MKIKEGTFNSSQVIESVQGNATLTSNIDAPHSNGPQFNGCQFNIGPGWQAATGVADSTISAAQELVLQGKSKEALHILLGILESEDFPNLSANTQRLSSIVYCDLCWQIGELRQAADFISKQHEELKSFRSIKAWHFWLQHNLGDTDGLDGLQALQKVYPESPTILNLSVMAGGELRESAFEAITKLYENGKLLSSDDYRILLLHLANNASDAGSLTQAREYLRHVTPRCETEVYTLQHMDLVYRVQGILKEPCCSGLDHISVSDWQEIKEIERKNNEVIEQSESVNHIFHDAYTLRSLLLALQGKHREAINAVGSGLYLGMNAVSLRNIGNCYQHMGDWVGLEEFILSLPMKYQTSLADLHFISLINQGKRREAAELDGVPEQLKSLLHETDENSGSVQLDEIADLHLGIQIARNRHLETQAEESIAYLLSIDTAALDIQTRFNLAEALLDCKCDTEALSHYECIFIELGAGIGNHFARFINLLLKNGRRSLASSYIDQCPDEMIFSSLLLTKVYINYLAETQGIKALIETLTPHATNAEYLWLKTAWLKSALMLNETIRARKMIEHWGLAPEGDPSEVAEYLLLASRCLPRDRINRSLYELFHSNSRNINVQKACFSFYFNFGEKAEQPAELEVALSPCAVLLDDEAVLIDDSLSGTNSPYYYTSNDELVADFIGKSKGETAQFNGRAVEIREVVTTDTWMAKKAIEELSKRPKTTSIFMVSGRSTEDAVAEIVENVRSGAEASRQQLMTSTDGKAPILFRLSRTPSDTLRAWLSVLFYEKGNKLAQEIELSHQSKQTLNDAETLVLDPTSACTLSICPHSLTQLLQTGIRLSIPPSVHQIFTSTLQLDKAIQPSGTLGWDFDEARAVYTESATDLKKPCESFLRHIENQKIEIISAIPNVDIPTNTLQLIQLLDEGSRDAIFSCYGHRNRILVSDDPYIRKIANQLGIKSTCTLNLLLNSTPNPSEDEAFQDEILELTSRNMDMWQIPVYLLLRAMSITASDDYARNYIDNNLTLIDFSGDNLSLVIFLIFWALASPELPPGFDGAVSAFTDRKYLGDKSLQQSDLLIRVWREVKKLPCDNQLRSSVAATTLKLLGLSLPFKGPFSTYEALRQST